MYSVLEWRYGGSFSCENTLQGHTETHKNTFFHIGKQVGEMVIMNDLE